MKNKKLFYLVYIFSIVVLLIPVIPVNSSNSSKHLSIPGDVAISHTILVITIENIDTNIRYILKLNNTHNDINKYPLPPNITNFELQVEIKGNEGDVVVITLLDTLDTLFDSLTFTIMEMASLFSADIISDLFIPILIIATFSTIFFTIMKSLFGNKANPINMLNHKSKKDHRSVPILDTLDSEDKTVQEITSIIDSKNGRMNSGEIRSSRDYRKYLLESEVLGEITEDEKYDFYQDKLDNFVSDMDEIEPTKIIEIIEPTNEISIDCMICRLPINMTDETDTCYECGSIFHQHHWKEWMKMKGFCPICKHKYRNETLEERKTTKKTL